MVAIAICPQSHSNVRISAWDEAGLVSLPTSRIVRRQPGQGGGRLESTEPSDSALGLRRTAALMNRPNRSRAAASNGSAMLLSSSRRLATVAGLAEKCRSAYGLEWAIRRRFPDARPYRQQCTLAYVPHVSR